MDIRDLSVSEIGLSTRAYNCLMRGGISTVGALVDTDADTLWKIKHMGRLTMEEVLGKIDEYRRKLQDQPAAAPSEEAAFDPDAWANSEESKAAIRACLERQGRTIDELTLLSARAYNLLSLCGCTRLHQVLFLSEGDLLQLPGMDAATAREIALVCRQYIEEHRSLPEEAHQISKAQTLSLDDLIKAPEFRETILRFVKANDRDITEMELSARPLSRLEQNGYRKLSEILFLTEGELKRMSGMGINSAQEILLKVHTYLIEHEARIRSLCCGDENALLTDEDIRANILRLYDTVGFGGLHYPEFKERLALPQSVSDERLKRVIGGLLADGSLEYVDFCCYRVYPPVAEYLKTCEGIDERTRDILQKRLDGQTLEEIGAAYGLTRERVRQVVKNGSDKLHAHFKAETKLNTFDEAYYRYFYETYAFEKRDGAQWLGITPEVFRYLEMLDCKKGKKPLEEAPDDEKLDAGLRLKIRSYLNRNRIRIDGRWIDKTRAALEPVVLKACGESSISFHDFGIRYNRFLEEHDIPFDEKLYYTDAVMMTRRNRLAEARFALWKQNEMLRYYDIDGREYSELYDELGLAGYENVELSTAKWFSEHPALMAKYDLQDHYELHNLLRKTVKNGSFHGMEIKRTPNVLFGSFDRDAALLSLMLDNAPISIDKLCELIHAEYGYDAATIKGSYLDALMPYYHQGVFSDEDRIMAQERLDALKAALPEDFYFTDEVRARYLGLFPDADSKEINPFNLKRMGFSVFSRYILQGHSSLEAYFRWLLTKEDMQDITPLRRRYGYVVMFGLVLMKLKRELAVIEYEPGRIVCFDRLARSGVTKDDLLAFCDAAYGFAPDHAYFSIQSLRQDGFDAPLFSLGFSDWFYASLLLADERFSFEYMYGNCLFRKDGRKETVRDFLEERIGDHGSVDMFSLMRELSDRYGCRIDTKEDIYTKLYGSPVYYDRFLDRLYANEGLYDREVAETEV